MTAFLNIRLLEIKKDFHDVINLSFDKRIRDVNLDYFAREKIQQGLKQSISVVIVSLSPSTLQKEGTILTKHCLKSNVAVKLSTFNQLFALGVLDLEIAASRTTFRDRTSLYSRQNLVRWRNLLLGN